VRIYPEDISGWSEIRKAGPNGLFLILMAISWMPECIASLPTTCRERVELNAILESLLCDVEWVLESVCESQLLEVPKANVPLQRGRKRKVVDNEGGKTSEKASANKKARKSK
jgi:hypothetical protein